MKSQEEIEDVITNLASKAVELLNEDGDIGIIVMAFSRTGDARLDSLLTSNVPFEDVIIAFEDKIQALEKLIKEQREKAIVH